MTKFQVRLLVLIALGTGALIPSTPAFPSWDCGFLMPVSLRFGGIEVTIPGSGLVYHRVTVRDVHLDLATKTSVSLPSDSFLECAIAAALAGMEAFVFDGNCTGYKLITHFLKCQTGDLVVYVRAHYLNMKPSVVPLDKAPFKPHSNNRRMYMLSTIVETENDYPTFLNTETTIPLDFYYNVRDVIYRENGDTFLLNGLIVDLNFCLSDGAYGLLFDVRQGSYDFPGDIIYFFEECGNTIQVCQYPWDGGLHVMSHAGFGCQYYPSGLPDECTVTFEVKTTGTLNAGYSFLFSETGSGDGGLNMTITGKDPKTGKLESRNMYQRNLIKTMIMKSTIEVSLLRQPSKRAIGFIISFTVY